MCANYVNIPFEMTRATHTKAKLTSTTSTWVLPTMLGMPNLVKGWLTGEFTMLTFSLKNLRLGMKSVRNDIGKNVYTRRNTPGTKLIRRA